MVGSQELNDEVNFTKDDMFELKDNRKLQDEIFLNEQFEKRVVVERFYMLRSRMRGLRGDLRGIVERMNGYFRA